MITEAVGSELRRVRERLGWTRNAVVSRMFCSISTQALANYEYGVRPCTVEKFVDICRAMGVSAADVLGAALQRAEVEQPVLRVDLAAVVRSRQPELRPFRRWARKRLADSTDTVACIDRAIVPEMATLFGLSGSEFLQHVLTFTPEPVPQ